jgi:hypothetical protein
VVVVVTSEQRAATVARERGLPVATVRAVLALAASQGSITTDDLTREGRLFGPELVDHAAGLLGDLSAAGLIGPRC